MNVFMQHAKTGLNVEAVLLGTLDDSAIVSLYMKDESVMKGIITFTDEGTIGFTNIMMYDFWHIVSIIPQGF